MHLHRPIEPGDMLILGCRVDDERTAHEVIQVYDGNHQLPRYLFKPACPCGYRDISALAPTIQDVIYKEMI